MADRIAKAILTVWLAGAALAPAAALAGPGFEYGHDDAGYADDTFLATPPAAAPLAAQRAPVAIAAPAQLASDGGTGSARAPAAASATRVVCHEVAGDATEENP